MPACPICGKDVRPRAENPASPFCTPRCQQIDLGKWLNEGYRVPTDEAPEAGHEASDRGPESKKEEE